MVADELHSNAVRDDAGFMSFLEKKAYGIASALAVIEGPLVDVHADEGVGAVGVEAASVLHCVGERMAPVLKAIRDTGV